MFITIILRDVVLNICNYLVNPPNKSFEHSKEDELSLVDGEVLGLHPPAQVPDGTAVRHGRIHPKQIAHFRQLTG